METSDRKPTGQLDPMDLILRRLEEVVQETRQIPSIAARLTTIESTFGEAVKELRSRDTEQQRQLEDLRLRQSELMSSLSMLSSAVKDMERLTGTLNNLQRNLDGIAEALSTQNNRIRILEDNFKEHVNSPEWRAKIDACTNEFYEWRPWLKAIRWATGIAGGILVAVTVAGILYAIFMSGAWKP